MDLGHQATTVQQHASLMNPYNKNNTTKITATRNGEQGRNVQNGTDVMMVQHNVSILPTSSQGAIVIENQSSISTSDKGTGKQRYERLCWKDRQRQRLFGNEKSRNFG